MPFLIELREKTLIIDLGYIFRYDIWVKDFPVIQKTLDEATYNGLNYKKISIDFSKCSWVDPLPILSLLLSTFESYKKGKEIELIVPDVDLRIKERETDKVIKYLYLEGFLSQFGRIASIISRTGQIVYDKPRAYTNEKILHSYSKINTSLYYTNSSILPAQIIDTKKLFQQGLEHIDKWIDDLLKKIQPQLRDKIPSFSQKSIVHRLTIILVEMISNIVKHAYENTDKTYAGIYIRFRNGLDNNSLSVEERKKLNHALKEEEYHCSRLTREFLDVRKGCLEIFIIDAGIGFSQSLIKGIGSERKHPFRDAYKMVFDDRQRREIINPPDHTYEGGLYYIGQMLSANQDYLFGRDENEWVGGPLPLAKDAYELTNGNDDPHLSGLSWIVRLSWKNETEIGRNKWKNWDGQIKHNPVYEELISDRLAPPTQFKIHDFRFTREELPGYKSGSGGDNLVLMFADANQTKFGIWNYFKKISANLTKSNDRVIIIADIPEYGKQIYLYSLEKINIQSYQTDHWIHKFNKIILVSSRLSVSILIKSDSTFVYSPELTESYLDNIDPSTFQPDKSLAHLIRWIRNYDSLIFWLNIKRLNGKSNSYYVNADILWSTEVGVISGYLDFAQTCTDAFCVKLYKIILERTIGIFGESYENNITYCRFENMDALTKRIVNEANASFFNEITETQDRLKIFVGSVFVSGASKDDALFYYDVENDKKAIHINFFLHDSSKVFVAHLLNWPKHDWLVKFDSFQETFRRVGKTHIIAEHGYKSFPIPRFFKDDSSAYFRNPRKTYNDWQDERNQIISFGHFEFEGKHDLFKINLIKVIEESFLMGLELSKFLLSEFFMALGGKSDKDLKPKGKKEYDFINKRRQEILDNNEPDPKVDLIVYPINSNAAFAIEKIKEMISNELTQKIFALMPVNKERVGSTLLISPLVIKSIKSILDQSTEKKVLLFDTSVISGRTRKELKHLLQGLGASEVRMLSITDRFRLPLHVQDKYRHKAYWRLDVPRLGSADMCPICKAIDILENFKGNLSSTLATKRIERIIESWKVVSYFDPVSDHGLKPTPIQPVEKKLGIKFNKNTNQFEQIISDLDRNRGVKNQILLRNSLGLTIYVSEMHAMTSRDDLALSLIHSLPNLSPVAKVELLCSQLLLFPNEYSKRVQFEMVFALFIACNEISQSDNWTGLATLVILLQNKEVHTRLIETIQIEGSKELKINNLDLNITIASILKNYNTKGVVISEKVFRLLKYIGEEKIINTYKQFHYEIYNDAGAIHSKPLIAFYIKNELIKQERLEDAINSISKLIFLLDNLQTWQFRRKLNNQSFLSSYRLHCKNLLSSYYERFEELIPKQNSNTEPNPSASNYIERFQTLQNDVETELVPHLQVLHNYLFCPVMTTEGCVTVKEEIQQIVFNIPENEWAREAENKNKSFLNIAPRVLVSKYADYKPMAIIGNKRNYWMICDQIMESEIRFTIMNAVHSRGPIKDIWSMDGDDKTLADMWINIIYSQENVQLLFANKSDKSAREIFQEIGQKNKEGILHLKDDLCGTFEVNPGQSVSGENVIIVKLTIPTI